MSDRRFQDALAALLPPPGKAAFLRACVLDGAEAGEAWTAWSASATRDGTALRNALAPVAAHLALLSWNLARNRIRLDARIETHLRQARLTEELRWQGYRAIAGDVFTVLGGAAIPFVVLKGAAFAESIYPDPALRHSADIDLWLKPEDLARASEVLATAGWRVSPRPELPNPKHAPPLVHPSGLTVELHHRLLIPHYTLPYDAIWARTIAARPAGCEARVLAPADAFLHAGAHGLGSHARWVTDAWFLLRAHPDLDWSTFLSTARIGRLELPLAVAVRYLAEHLGMAIPPHVTAALDAAARRTGFLGRQAAKPWSHGATWWRRAFPPPVSFALRHDVRLATLPFYYVLRLMQIARRKVHRRLQSGARQQLHR